MKTNSLLFIAIALLLIAGIIGVGGKVYKDKKDADKMSVVALKNTFEDI